MLKQALEEQFMKAVAKDPLKGLRAQGWERFITLGLPDKRSEAFQYLPLSQLYAESYGPGSYADVPINGLANEGADEGNRAHLVFINGFFAKNRSSFPEDIVVLPLKEALLIYGNFLQNRWSKRLQEEKDSFAALNAALHGSGVFIYVPPKRTKKLQVQCHHVITESALIGPRVHLFVGTRSEVDWITTVQETGRLNYWMNSFVDMALEEAAIVQQVELYQHRNPLSWFFESRQATLKSFSRLFGMSITTGSKSQRLDHHVSLNGPHCEARLQGLWVLQGNLQAHTNVVMDHVAPHCQSMQFFKGILDDSAKSSFQGKIFVRPNAQKTQAYQLNNHLLLGERAIANSKPNLEIFADDVKASHGATVAQVDREQLFYLKARGILEKTAKNLLTIGFCKELLDQIPISFLRETMKAQIHQVLKL